MKKKRMTVIVVVAIVAVAAVLSAAFFLRPKEAVYGVERPEQGMLELIGLADTEAQAEQMATDYGIQLIRYAEGVATFQTDKTYDEIVEIGQEKGLEELSINDTNTIY